MAIHDTPKLPTKPKAKSKRLIRGRLRPVQPRGPALDFQYNPPSMPRTGGGGGWSRVTRPRRVESMEWVGLTAKSYTFLLSFDGWPDRAGAEARSVEGDIRRLFDMYEPRDRGKPPPIVEFEFGPVGRGQWVIDSIDAGDELRNEQLQRIRADFTVTVVEYNEGDVTFKSAAHRHNAKQGDGGKQRTYKIKRGDTLASIASRELGNYKKWKSIARLNDINHIVMPRDIGKKIKLPKG